MEVGCVVDRCRENAFAVFAFAFAIELLPPFAEEVEFRVVVYENLDFLAGAVEGVASFGVCERLSVCAVDCGLCHIGGTLYEGMDIESGNGDRQQSHGSEHRETAAYIVRNDVCLISFGRGECAESSAFFVGDCHDAFASLVAAHLCFELLFEEAESDGRLSGSARFRYDDNAEFAVAEIFLQLGHVVFANVLSGEEHASVCRFVSGEGVAERLDNGFCTEVRATDANGNHYFAIFAQT